MTIELRDANTQDKDDCIALLGELRSATGSADVATQGGCYESLLDRARGQIIVAEEAGSILGMATVSYNLALRYGGEYCQLEELIVTPTARRRNLGGLLVERVLKNARSRGCAEIGLYLLETTEHNRPFYEKYGFQVLGKEMRLKFES